MQSRYALHTMRTTISLEDRLAMQVRREASLRGVSVSRFIATVLDDALKRTETREAPAFRLVRVGGDGPRPGFDVDRPRAFEVEEDEAHFVPPRR